MIHAGNIKSYGEHSYIILFIEIVLINVIIFVIVPTVVVLTTVKRIRPLIENN